MGKTLLTRIAHIASLLALFTVLLFGCYAWWWLSVPQNMPIARVSVYAPYDHLSHDDIQQVILPLTKQGFL
ncbi:MAG: hypothetical protein KDH94_06865, partial [Coxiellaceae bacterium]|nr:hypothetical protein [Coxiellaceae bacterium]